MFEKIGKAVAMVVIFVVIVMLSGLLTGFPTKWLWNWLMPDLFGLKQINFWQAWGLMALGSFLFKSSSSEKEA